MAMLVWGRAFYSGADKKINTETSFGYSFAEFTNEKKLIFSYGEVAPNNVHSETAKFTIEQVSGNAKVYAEVDTYVNAKTEAKKKRFMK